MGTNKQKKNYISIGRRFLSAVRQAVPNFRMSDKKEDEEIKKKLDPGGLEPMTSES